MYNYIDKPSQGIVDRMLLENARPMCVVDDFDLWVVNPPIRTHMPPMVLYTRTPPRSEKANCAIIGTEIHRYKWLASQAIWLYSNAQHRLIYEVKVNLSSGYSRTLSREMNEYPADDAIWLIMSMGWCTIDWYINEAIKFQQTKIT